MKRGPDVFGSDTCLTKGCKEPTYIWGYCLECYKNKINDMFKESNKKVKIVLDINE